MSADPAALVHALLSGLSDCRCRLAFADGKPVVRTPKGGFAPEERERFDRLLPLLTEYRELILQHWQAAPEVPAPAAVPPPEPEPWGCDYCRRWYYAPRREVRELMSPAVCDLPRCPQRCTAMDTETVEFARLVQRMRAVQQKFFAGQKDGRTVGEAKDLEKQVNKATEAILYPPRSLFDGPDLGEPVG